MDGLEEHRNSDLLKSKYPADEVSMLLIEDPGLYISDKENNNRRFSKPHKKYGSSLETNTFMNDKNKLSDHENNDGFKTFVDKETIREQSAFEVLTTKECREERFNLLVNKNNLT